MAEVEGRQAIIIHGKPSRAAYEESPTDPSDSHWLPWAKHQLHLAGIPTFTPDMPAPYEPDYKEWERALNLYTTPHQRGTTFVGLSAGASFLLRYLGGWGDWMERQKLILVAPWLDLEKKYGDFGDFEINRDLVERCVGGLTVFYSSQDDKQAQASLEVIRNELPDARYIDIPQYGHFMLGNTMETPEFPELIEEVLGENQTD